MYRIYEQTERKTGKKRIIAISTYAKKEVKGIASCNPNDEYDYSKGCNLAMARCNLKVAEKRRKNAQNKYEEALENLTNAKNEVAAMEEYLRNASNAEDQAYCELQNMLKDY